MSSPDRNYVEDLSLYTSHLVDFGYGPQVGSYQERTTFIEKTIKKQDSILHALHAPQILERLNEKFLKGMGTVTFTYGGVDNGKSDTTSTVYSLNLDTFAGKKSPRLMIGFVGDGKKLGWGEENYMTHMAVMYMNDLSDWEQERAERESIALENKLPIKVDGSLTATTYTPKQWEHLENITEKKATKLLQQKLQEAGLLDRHSRRWLRRGITVAGAIGTGIIINEATNVVDNVIVPIAKTIFEHIPH